MRVAGVLRESLQDGKGCNLVVFTQGCNICCPGCHNKDTWDRNGGTEVSVDTILSNVTAITTGLTVSGGEPTLQYDEVKTLLMLAKGRGLTTTLYSGLTREQWDDWGYSFQLAQYCDYIKLGPYVEELRDITLGYAGSTNQVMYKVDNSDSWPILLKK
jgi:anaerobic ribonucleoside-triphosphate reductase activating protein